MIRRVRPAEARTFDAATEAGIGRRAFLQVTTTVAGGAMFLGPGLLAAELAAPPQRLAVGFVDWPWDNIDQARALDVVDARTIHQGSDPSFLRRDARVSVVSSGNASSSPRTRRAVELTAYFSYFEGSERRVAPFHAWTYDRVTGDAGNPVRFNVPLDEDQALRMSLLTDIAGPAVRRRAVGGAQPAAPARGLPFVLSLRNEPASLRLVPGYFVLVPLAAGEAEPSWSSYALRQSEGRWRLIARDGELAAMEHLVLRIGFAS